MAKDPLDIADPVAVRISERAGIDLIDDGAPPPLVGAGVTGTLNDRYHGRKSFVPNDRSQRFRTFGTCPDGSRSTSGADVGEESRGDLHVPLHVPLQRPAASLQDGVENIRGEAPYVQGRSVRV